MLLHSMRLTFALSLVSLFLCVHAQPVDGSEPGYPRLANFYLHGYVDPQAIEPLSKWDVLILSTSWDQESLERIRELNRDIKIFLYVCPYCLKLSHNPTDPWKEGALGYATHYDLWWYDRNGKIASDWPGTGMLNITSRGLRGPLGRWGEFMSLYIEWLVESRPAVDGVFLDNYWKSISWNQDRLQLDSDCHPTFRPADCDGAADPKAELDSLWNEALRELAQELRSSFDRLERDRDRPLAIISNGASDYFESLNGTLYELFPRGSETDYGNPFNYAWRKNMFDLTAGYVTAPFRRQPYRVSVVNAGWRGSHAEPARSPAFERHKRFTLVSSLLGEGYYSLDASEITQLGHGALWWEPEYDHAGRGKGYLGQPRTPAYVVGQPGPSLQPEMLRNASFDQESADWQKLVSEAQGSVESDLVIFHSAPAAMRLQVTQVVPDGYVKLWQFPVNLREGQAYTLSFRAVSPEESRLRVQIYSEDCRNNHCLPRWTVRGNWAWQNFERSFIASATTQAGVDFFLDAPGSVWIDDVSLREGDRSVYRRDFENGSVFLNYTAEPVAIPLGQSYYKLFIPGSTVFDGTAVESAHVPPWDGLILLRTPTAGVSKASQAPVREDLAAPNPMRSGARIQFQLRQPGRVRVEIHDAMGRLVKRLVDEHFTRVGVHEIRWDGTGQSGNRVAAGVYMYVLTGPQLRESNKIILLKE